MGHVFWPHACHRETFDSHYTGIRYEPNREQDHLTENPRLRQWPHSHYRERDVVRSEKPERSLTELEGNGLPRRNALRGEPLIPRRNPRSGGDSPPSFVYKVNGVDDFPHSG